MTASIEASRLWASQFASERRSAAAFHVSLTLLFETVPHSCMHVSGWRQHITALKVASFETFFTACTSLSQSKEKQ